MPPEREGTVDTVVIGGRRIGPVAWLGLGLLLLALLLMSLALWRFSGQGPWPVPIIWAVGALVALRLLTTREVRIARDGVTVTRDTLGWRRTRQRPAAGIVLVRGDHSPSRHQHGDGTPEGEAQLLLFTVTLGTVKLARPRLTLDTSRDVDAMEALARRVAAVTGLPALRRGYLRRPSDGLPVRARKDTESPLT